MIVHSHDEVTASAFMLPFILQKTATINVKNCIGFYRFVKAVVKREIKLKKGKITTLVRTASSVTI
jgi:hypothetical protein